MSNVIHAAVRKPGQTIIGSSYDFFIASHHISCPVQRTECSVFQIGIACDFRQECKNGSVARGMTAHGIEKGSLFSHGSCAKLLNTERPLNPRYESLRLGNCVRIARWIEEQITSGF